MLNPHLFTHLFHGGVIVSTRKLVYDAGANEEAIKALMQAQHKAVMKDLMKGAFDDKIDQYLGGTEGLEAAPDRPGRASTDVDDRDEPETPAPAPAAAVAPEPAPAIAERPEPSAPSIEIIPASESAPVLLTKPRTKTEDRTSTSKLARANPPSKPPPVLEEDEAPTLNGPDAKEVAAQLRRAATPPPVPSTARLARLQTPPPVPYKHLPQDFRIDSSPEIEISIGDEDSGRARAPRDTAVETPVDVTIPTAMPEMPAVARRSDSAAPGTRKTPTGDRPPSLVGATLPPAPRPPSRPAFTPPQVMSRPIAPPEGRSRDSDAVEVYAPAPPSADAPPGERSRGGGQYSLGRGKGPSDGVPLRESTGRIPAVRPTSSSSPPQRSQQGSSPPPIRPPQPTPSAGVPQARPPQVTTPMAARTPPAGVVMTRPAVIVGAPPKPAAAPPPRVRKAREDEGRGFGQGLISEKSLDEVILAYLSEDAEEK